MPRKKEVYMGSVNVDSGQLVICDPCYIDSQWKEEDFEDIRIYKNINTGDTVQYGVDFKNYESPIEKYDNQTMNQLLGTGKWKSVEDFSYENPFSYNACAQTTLSNDGFGELDLGTAVVLSTTIGDGRYPVFGKFNDDGILDSVIIKITAKHFN
jgi:hypothetical protein